MFVVQPHDTFHLFIVYKQQSKMIARHRPVKIFKYIGAACGRRNHQKCLSVKSVSKVLIHNWELHCSEGSSKRMKKRTR